MPNPHEYLSEGAGSGEADQMTDGIHGHQRDQRDQAVEWDERYAESNRIWSSLPNGTVVTELAGVTPGRALDVGCGEGADSVWLAGRGWDVTGLDVSSVALGRAAMHAREAGVEVDWIPAGLLEADLGTGVFDLVSAQYPALRTTATREAERALLDAVAPGGLLLVVHHADVDVDTAKAHGFDPADYVTPADVCALLDDDWTIEVDERRARHVTGGAGAGHTHDLVLRATRIR